MKKLEDEGYLYQPHASGGRIPTDKAYRFYVDYLSKVQKIAVKERERIEKEYRQNTDEINRVMVQTSRMLSMLSGSAGFVLANNVQDTVVQRLDFIPLGPYNALAVLITEDGIIKHWPVRVNYLVSAARLMLLSGYINEQISGLTLREAQRVLWENLRGAQADVDGFSELALQILKDMSSQRTSDERLYIEGMSHLLENISQDDGDIGRMLSILEDREKITGFLSEKMREMQSSVGGRNIAVSIGAENEIAELRDLSVVSSVYKVSDKTVGILGIVGPKHMEYNRMMSIVNFVGEMLGTTIQNWKNSLEKTQEK
jgi:heat-inducible transcriptional repressor